MSIEGDFDFDPRGDTPEVSRFRGRIAELEARQGVVKITDEFVRAFLNNRHGYSLEPGDPAWTEIKEDLAAAALVVAGDQTCGVCKGTGKTRDGQWCLICDVSALPAPPAPKEG